ncbi:hypothetical protein WJX72_004703 [[Myrmecia] bisecta]|uniref:DNA replication licensing factor MCM2 n=1 Tax=[Myrmecia] bisecta TaxID=41462 RepID=A0AAW1PDK2_9CHLO
MADEADMPLPDEGPERQDSDVDSRVHSEAEEEEEEDVQQGSDDEDGEDLLANAEGDYRAQPHLDNYEEEGLASEGEVEDMTYEEQQAARLEAERALNRRDLQDGPRVGARRGRDLLRLPGALLGDEDDEEESRPRRRRRIQESQAGEEDEEEHEAAGELAVDLSKCEGPAMNWIPQEPVRKQIAREFKAMLHAFEDEHGEKVYRTRIKSMCIANKQSLEVQYGHVAQSSPTLAIWLADCPKAILEIFHTVAKEVALEEYPTYEQVHGDIFVRITNLPIIDLIRDIRQYHLNNLIRVTGVVTRRTGVFPQLEMVKYDCMKCGYVLGPFYQNTETEIKVGSCPQCQSHGPFQVNVAETIYRNYQKITLQESPGTVPAGRLPRHKEVILLHDLIDSARPGEEIDVVGIYTHNYDPSLNVKHGFPVFSTMIEANYVHKNEDEYAAFKLTSEDKEEITQLAMQPNIGDRICRSIAPSIYGHLNIKTGIALALFGGQEKHPSGNHRLRGDINMLLMGDPGTAKSQFLKYVEKVAQRAVYTTGKGASAVGLTASVQKDPITREWTLEGGALVLADKGVCLIDEFDKMNDQDRVSIHEAMEQQSISISKAGIVTSLQARCSVIAAANPIGGRYDSSRTFAENVELSDPILSRFDILCVVKDVVDPVSDEKLANFVVDSHTRSHPDYEAVDGEYQAVDDPDLLSQDMLRKYITYAKQFCRPKLQNADYDKIATVYSELRRESAISHGMPIAVRHLESVIRMSEAHAAMHLRAFVNDKDVDAAIRVLLESFIATQKMSVQKALRKKFKKYIVDRDHLKELIMHSLQSLVREQLRFEQLERRNTSEETHIRIPCRSLEERLREFEIDDLQPFYASHQFNNGGFALDVDTQAILLAR